MTALMRTADLFVCPSRHEGLGSIVMESWAHDCPIIATNSQGPGELIDDGQTGLVTPVDEVEPLAMAIRKLLDDTSFMAYLKANADKLYWEKFCQRVIVEQYENLYSTILS